MGLLFHLYDSLRVAILLQQLHVDVQLLLVFLHLVRAQQLKVERCDAVGHEAAFVFERVLVVLQHVGGELWWIGQVQAVEQAEVGETEHNGVELDENRHHLEVYLLARLGLEGIVMWDDPGDLLALDLRLEVVALDGDEHLAQRLGGDHIVQEFNSQSAAQVRLFAGNQVQRGKGAEQEEQSQAVV